MGIGIYELFILLILLNLILWIVAKRLTRHQILPQKTNPDLDKITRFFNCQGTKKICSPQRTA